MTAINPSIHPAGMTHPADMASGRPTVAGRGTRRAMLWIGSVFTVLALLAGLFRLLTAVAYDQHFENLTFTAAELASVDEVSIRNSTGHVEVTGTRDPDARVEVDVGDGLFRARHRSVIEGGALALEASCPLGFATRCRVHHDVELPAPLGVNVHSRMGHVSITDFDGDVDVSERFGSVSLERVGGAVAVDQRFGDVTARALVSPSVSVDNQFGSVTLAFDNSPVDVRVTSTFGQVTIELPDDGAAYRISGSTDFGERTVDVRIDPDSDRAIHVDSTFGQVTIRYLR